MRLSCAWYLASALSLALLLGVAQSRSSASLPHRKTRLLSLRGGETVAHDTTSSKPVSIAEEHAWCLEQLLLRQQRLGLLSDALRDCGIDAPTIKSGAKTGPVSKGWDCTISTEENPKSCLIMGEVPYGCRSVAPSGSGKWVSLWEFNSMRRDEPHKISSLWYDQFLLNCKELDQHLGPLGFILSSLLDHKAGLRGVLGILLLATGFILRTPLHFLLIRFLTWSVLWNRHFAWSRLLYAPLPAKLFFLSIIWRRLVVCNYEAFEGWIRRRLIELECDMLECSVPTTVDASECD